MSDSSAKRFSEDQAKAIIARAIEIDTRAPMTTHEQLRSIVAEIGVSEASLEAAIREEETLTVARRATSRSHAAWAVVAAGVPLGIAAGSLLSAGGDIAILSVLALRGIGLVASGALVVLNGAHGTLRSFHARNAALWAGVAAGSLIAVSVASDGSVQIPAVIAASWSVRNWLTSSIVGSAAVVAIRMALRGDNAGSGGKDAVKRKHRLVEVTKRVFEKVFKVERTDVMRMVRDMLTPAY